ncbi:hypothetical protein [Sphingobacterium gobiense]|nr:hypothetical protein [Sphingobacterium gobiense]
MDKDLVFEATFKDIADTSQLHLTYVAMADLDDEYKYAELPSRSRDQKLPYQLVEHNKIRLIIPAHYTVRIISRRNGRPDYFKECKITVDEKRLVLDGEALQSLLKRRRNFDIIGVKKYLKINDAVFR